MGAARRRPISSQLGAAVFDVASESEAASERCGGPLPIPDPSDPRSARRRALVVLSDGADENSRASFAQVLTAARATSVPVFPLALGYANEDQTLKSRLAELARATGGRLIESAGPDALQASYGEIVELLRSSYLLGYYPSAAGSQVPPDRRSAGQIEEGHFNDIRLDCEPLVRVLWFRCYRPVRNTHRKSSGFE